MRNYQQQLNNLLEKVEMAIRQQETHKKFQKKAYAKPTVNTDSSLSNRLSKIFFEQIGAALNLDENNSEKDSKKTKKFNNDFRSAPKTTYSADIPFNPTVSVFNF